MSVTRRSLFRSVLGAVALSFLPEILRPQADLVVERPPVVDWAPVHAHFDSVMPAWKVAAMMAMGASEEAIEMARRLA